MVRWGGRRGIVPLACRCLAAAVAIGALGGSLAARQQGQGPALRGTVTVDRGQVRAFRVRATDPARRIAYTVFTQKGQYQFHRLPPGPYDVRVVEEDVASPAQRVEVRSGTTLTVDLKTTATPPQGGVELVDFDALYPPGPARDVMVRSCFPCHSSAGKGHLGTATSAWHRKGGRTEAQWRATVERMFKRPAGFPLLTDAMVRPAEKESIIRYLTANFGPGSKARDLKLDPLVRDEAALAQARYIQYELPPGYNIHDAFPSQVQRGLVWLSGTLGAVVGVDTTNPDMTARTRAWRIPAPADKEFVHGIIEDRGLVYWTEIAGDHIGVLNPATGELTRHPVPTRGAWQHTLRADSKGNVWFSNFTSASQLGKFEPGGRAVREYDLLEKWRVTGWNGYGLTVDRRDRVWSVGLTTPAIGMYDSVNDRWATFPIPSPARRLAVDAKGRVWACQFFGNALSRIDPDTGKVTEFPLPLKYGSPYEVWPDAADNLWVTNDVYNALVKFDQGTSRYTYVPYPDLEAHTPKLETDAAGTLWFGMRIGLESDEGYAAGLSGTTAQASRTAAPRWKLTAFQERGNAP